jgi:broad specificity phosphatase PhoE
MSEHFPVVYVARHGETAWSLTGQHTGFTDLPLTPNGERNAQRLRDRLKGLRFAKVFASPLQRVFRTCELAGFGATAETDPDLVEWDYGQYEGRRSSEIHTERPDWQLFRDGCPGGEMPDQVGERADRVVRRIRAVAGNVLCFPAATSFECWPRGGWGSGQDRRAGILLSARRASARSVMSTIFLSQ